MKKLNQGKYEIFTTKTDAIDKLMQMQGVCRERVCEDEHLIQFYCSKKGKITIANPPSKHERNWNSTELWGEVIEQEGKTFVTFYTSYSTYNNFYKLFTTILDIIIAILAIVFSQGIFALVIMLFCFAFLAYELSIIEKEKRNSPKDSEILIKELEKRIDAVNKWDK